MEVSPHEKEKGKIYQEVKMASNERNLNITLRNQEDDKDEVVISFSAFLRKLKKYVFTWVIAAVIFFVAAFGYAALTTHVKKPSLRALIGFSYSGIEKGLDPNGRKFDIYSVSNPNVIEAALTNLNMDLKYVEDIRQGISFYGIIPKDAADRITVYDSVYQNANSNSLQAAEKMLETTYYSTQFNAYFDYNNTELSSAEALNVFNEILNVYQQYFYETYGYNESIGSAVTAIDYKDYDYPEALDIFRNSLSSLRKYVSHINSEDTTRFRSAETGYTFEDLIQSIRTIESVDLDRLSSYITVNNVTKNKQEALNYCEYRLKALERQKTEIEEEIKVYDDSIAKYTKDQVVIFGNSDVNVDTTVTQASAQYDKMINQKNNAAADLAETKQNIAYYEDRRDALKMNVTANDKQKEEVEAKLDSLNSKVNTLVDVTAKTADDYFENVTFKNAYNVLVPASDTASDKIGRIIENVKLPLVALEALGLMLFFGIALIESIVSESRKKRALASGDSSYDDDDDDDDDAEEGSDDAAVSKVVEAMIKQASGDNPVNKKKKRK